MYLAYKYRCFWLIAWTVFCLMFVGCSFTFSCFGEGEHGALKKDKAKVEQQIAPKPIPMAKFKGVTIYAIEIDGVQYYMTRADEDKSTFDPFKVPATTGPSTVEKPDKEL